MNAVYPGAATWDDVVARLDAAEDRSSRRVRRDLARAASTVALDGYDHLPPIERRAGAALAVRDALAAYRLAGGTPEHLQRVLAFTTVVGTLDDVVGSLGDRARLARARLELALEHVDDDNADEHAAHVADVEQGAARLERPRAGSRRLDACGAGAARVAGGRPLG